MRRAALALCLLTTALSTQAQALLRPQLTAEQAARHQAADYLQGWQPQPLDPSAWRPDWIVAADGSGTHRTVQAALDALPAAEAGAAGEGRRRYILVKPGVYREPLCARGKAPFTLYGDPAARRPTLVEGRYSAQPKPVGQAVNACVGAAEAASYGTAGSASVALIGEGIQLLHLRIVNDAMDGVRLGQGYPPGAGERGGAQAVALLLQGDRHQLQQLELLGHQDTFYVAREAERPGPARVHVRDSLIAGDVDFIFGNASLVIEGGTVLSRAGRRAPGEPGHVLAPSTLASEPYGFLLSGVRMRAEPGLRDGSASLGRAWDQGVKPGSWRADLPADARPNGQALIRDSELGPHLGPWAASTARRPFEAGVNRLSEFNNRAARRDWGRERLALDDGWAAAEGGTTGGSAAAPEDVYEVHNRAELERALAAGSRPKIIRLHRRIDLSRDAQDRPLGYEDYRDPDFDFQAYVQAYDPARWGRRPPEGPLEEARKRSVRRQAERVVLRLPSNTTLIGVGPEAGFINGMVLLERVQNLILRGLHFADAYDFFPAWDPNDNAAGEWNSEYDTLSLRGARHVWIDHCSFDDGPRVDGQARVALGRPLQHHDGLLDITQQSDLVTVSWNRFSRHDKTTLVGGSDAHRQDEGRLRVTFHHNLWEAVKERTPRVRYGQVHLYNNLFVGRSAAAGGGDYAYGYSIGVGLRSRIVSEANVFETSPDIPSRQLVRLLKGQGLRDSGSVHNGRPIDLLALLREAHPEAALIDEPGWSPLLRGPLDPAEAVAQRVRAGAGAIIQSN